MPRPPRKAPEWPFPSVLPGQPVKPWADPDTGLPVHTVAIRLPDGGWLAFIAEWPEMRATARRQAAAERRVLRLYARSQPREWLRHARVQWKARHDPDSVTEDELDLMLIELAKREKGPWVPAEKVLKRFGYGPDGKPLPKAARKRKSGR